MIAPAREWRATVGPGQHGMQSMRVRGLATAVRPATRPLRARHPWFPDRFQTLCPKSDKRNRSVYA
jgi:hypothetical protein